MEFHDLIILVINDFGYMCSVDPFNYMYASIIVCILILTIKRSIS